MSSNGGGGATTQMGQWSDGIAPYETAMLQRALTNFNQTADRPFVANPYAQVAPLAGDTLAAQRNIQGIAQNGTTPGNAGMAQAAASANGTYLGQNPGSAANPFGGLVADNPYIKQLTDQGANDLLAKYNAGTAADTKTMFDQSGAFGGSAHQQALDANQTGLARGLSSYYNQANNDQINRAAGLSEQDLARQSGNYNAERSNMLQGANLGYQGEGLLNTRNQNLLASGDITRLQNQATLNQNSTNWQDQQNYQNRMLSQLGDFISRATGGLSTGSTTTTTGPTANPYSALLGGGLLANGLFRGGT